MITLWEMRFASRFFVLLSRNAHAAHEDVGRTEYRQASRNTPFDFVAKALDLLQEIKEIPRYGEGFDGLGALAVADHKARALNGEISRHGVRPRVEALAFVDINAVSNGGKKLLLGALSCHDAKVIGRDDNGRGISSVGVARGLNACLFGGGPMVALRDCGIFAMQTMC